MGSDTTDISGYRFGDARKPHTYRYLWDPVLEELQSFSWGNASKNVFDLGCGNGSTAAYLTQKGYSVTGVDPSIDGIRQAHENYPDLDLHLGSAYDALAAQYGTFPVVVSLEVVEHVYDPRSYASCVYDLLDPGGEPFSQPRTTDI